MAHSELIRDLGTFGRDFEACGGVRALILADSFWKADDDNDDATVMASELEYRLDLEEAHRGLSGEEEELVRVCAAHDAVCRHYGTQDWVQRALTDYYGMLGRSADEAGKAYRRAVRRTFTEPKIEEVAEQALALSEEVSALPLKSFMANELAEAARHNLEMASTDLRTLLQELRAA